MSNLQKHITYRLLFVGIVLALSFARCLLMGNPSTSYLAGNECSWSYILLVIPIAVVSGIIDLIVLATKKKLTWAKFFVFLVIVALLISVIFIIDYL